MWDLVHACLRVLPCDIAPLLIWENLACKGFLINALEKVQLCVPNNEATNNGNQNPSFISDAPELGDKGRRLASNYALSRAPSPSSILWHGVFVETATILRKLSFLHSQRKY